MFLSSQMRFLSLQVSLSNKEYFVRLVTKIIAMYHLFQSDDEVMYLSNPKLFISNEICRTAFIH